MALEIHRPNQLNAPPLTALETDIQLPWVSIKRPQKIGSAPLSVVQIPQKGQGTEGPFEMSMHHLAPENTDALFAELENNWTGPRAFLYDLEHTVTTNFEQSRGGTPSILNAHFYVAADRYRNPFGLIGLYTVDMRDASGFVTMPGRDLDQSHLVTSLAWFAVSERYRRSGAGSHMLTWVEGAARSKGAHMMAIDTSDDEYEAAANRLYRKTGYEMSFDVPNFFGPGRDMFSYYDNVAKSEGLTPPPREEITPKNADEVLDCARDHLSPARFTEFIDSLGLFLKHRKVGAAILTPGSFVMRNANGAVESFCIAQYGCYENLLHVCWDVAPSKGRERLLGGMKGLARQLDKDILLIQREGRADSYLDMGLQSGKDGVGPNVFGKDDDSVFLFYTKTL